MLLYGLFSFLLTNCAQVFNIFFSKKEKKKISIHLLNLYFAICPYLNIYKDDFMEHIITIIILPYLNIYKDDFKENIITIIAIITCLSYLLKKDKYKTLLSD